jgi:hypothetical protein
MGTTTSHRGGYGTGYSGRSIQPQNAFWGWSHQNQQLEMMDLPAYLDSLRQTYDAALRDMSDRMQSLSTMYAPAPGGPAGRRHHHHRGHGHHDHDHDCGCGGHKSDHDCGCGHKSDHDCGCSHKSDHDCGCGDHDKGCGCRDDDCGCECCVEDADVIVYAHCGELRVVPIEVANDTRRDREDVSVEISEVRSAGGRELPWSVSVNPKGPLTLPPCSTTKLELVVYVNCREKDPSNGDNGSDTEGPRRTANTGTAKDDDAAASVRTVVSDQYESGDVDQCEVGYVTIRLGGCLVSPIVVAIAVLPDRCDSYRAGCSCSCCC